MRLLALIGKELRTFLRVPALVFVVVFLFVVHPYQSAAQSSQSGFALSNYPVAAYDLDGTPQSVAFIEKLRPPYFTLRRMVRTDGEISGLLDRGEVSMVVVVAAGVALLPPRGGGGEGRKNLGFPGPGRALLGGGRPGGFRPPHSPGGGGLRAGAR